MVMASLIFEILTNEILKFGVKINRESHQIAPKTIPTPSTNAYHLKVLNK